jgi:hypothetical protein
MCGLLWNCSDIMPGLLVDQLNDFARWPEDELKRRTYAAGARFLKARIEAA